LRRIFHHGSPLPILDNTSGEPLAYQAQDSPVSDSVLKKSQHLVVIDGVEERLDVCIEHPVDPFPLQPHPRSIQRLMLVAPQTKPIREAEEVGLADRAQHRHHRLLDEFVSHSNAQ
jgi:hypothetical protein